MPPFFFVELKQQVRHSLDSRKERRKTGFVNGEMDRTQTQVVLKGYMNEGLLSVIRKERGQGPHS